MKAIPWIQIGGPTARCGDVTYAGVILSPLAVAGSNDTIRLSGSFGVFFTGKLQAHLYDLGGVLRQVVDLQSVEPQTRAELHREVKPSKWPTRISIHLIGSGVGPRQLGRSHHCACDRRTLLATIVAFLRKTRN